MKYFLVRKDSKVLKICLNMCVCLCVCVWERERERDRQRETERTLLSPQHPSHASITCAPVHIQINIRVQRITFCGLKIFYTSSNCKYMRNFIITITFQSKVFTLVVYTQILYSMNWKHTLIYKCEELEVYKWAHCLRKVASEQSNTSSSRLTEYEWIMFHSTVSYQEEDWINILIKLNK